MLNVNIDETICYDIHMVKMRENSPETEKLMTPSEALLKMYTDMANDVEAELAIKEYQVWCEDQASENNGKIILFK